MKNGIVILFALAFLTQFSCTERQPTRDELVKKNIIEYTKAGMNDPDSYEFVSLVLIDSVLFSDNIEYEKGDIVSNLEFDRGLLESKESFNTKMPGTYGNDEIEELKDKIERNERILAKIDSIAIQLGDRVNEVASYTYIYSFRGNNAFGAKVLNEFLVQTGSLPGLEILNLAADRGKQILHPNKFPGYREIVN